MKLRSFGILAKSRPRTPKTSDRQATEQNGSGRRLVGLRGEVHAGAGLGVWPSAVSADQVFAGEELQCLGHGGLLELLAPSGGDHLGSGRALQMLVVVWQVQNLSPARYSSATSVPKKRIRSTIVREPQNSSAVRKRLEPRPLAEAVPGQPFRPLRGVLPIGLAHS